jgi:hypothetical protein
MRFPKKLGALALAASLAFPAFAGTIFNGYAIVKTTGSDTFYDTDTPTANPDWTAGLASLMQGSSLWLGGEVSTFPNFAFGGNDSYDLVRLQYSIDGGSNNNLTLGGPTSSGNNNTWQTLASSAGAVEIGSMLSVGAHTINVRFSAFDSNGNSSPVALDNNGNGWTTNFNVTAVPEPASGALILAGLGMLGVMAKRRRVLG